MNVSRKMFALLLLSLLVGCSDTHKLVRAGGVGLPASKDVSAYIVLPRDGLYGSIYYAGSGAMVAQAVDKAFSPYLKKSEIAIERESLEVALKTAKEKGFDYLSLFRNIALGAQEYWMVRQAGCGKCKNHYS